MTTLKKQLTAKTLPEHLANDLRIDIAKKCATDFGKLLRNFLKEKTAQSRSFTLLSLWHITSGKESCELKITSPDAKCAGTRWLKSRWDGQPLTTHDFHQLLGVIAGTQSFHNDLLQLQQIALNTFKKEHPLHHVANISFLLQSMLLCALTNTEQSLEIPSVVSISTMFNGKQHLLQLNQADATSALQS